MYSEREIPTIGGFKGGKTIGYIYCGGTPAGVLHCLMLVGQGLAKAVRELKKMGIKTANAYREIAMLQLCKRMSSLSKLWM
ncbi:hypothetical protein M0R45_000281 [Rubus argutus]|uniref:Uncharacterized protein n=1 Tax=Rubus argutus TaxID=59490 RepID=A0AAW1VLD8_RUBAR